MKGWSPKFPTALHCLIIMFLTIPINPLSANLTKWSNTLKQFVGKLPTNCLSVFDHFVGLVLKGLRYWKMTRKIFEQRSSKSKMIPRSLFYLKKCFNMPCMQSFVSEWCLYHFSQWKMPAWRYIVQKLTKIVNWKLTKFITYQKIGKINSDL